MSAHRSSVRRTLELIRPYRWALLRSLVLLIGLTVLGLAAVKLTVMNQ